MAAALAACNLCPTPESQIEASSDEGKTILSISEAAEQLPPEELRAVPASR